MPQRTPFERLVHILDNAERALLFVEGRKREDLEKDTQLLYALLHCLQIIGEAASGIPKPMRERFPSVPWDLMVHMRHHLVHDYDAVIGDIVWNTVQQDLPRLVEEISKVIPPEHT